MTPAERRAELCNAPENRMTTHDPIPARLAALKTTPTPDLKAQWRDLFDSEPPPFNRRYLESRLAYRIQELAYGGLKPETIRRLERLGEELDGGDRKKSRIRADHHAHRRHAADPRMAGRRACRHRHRRRLRVAGAALQVAVRHRPRHHRHALERLGLLRPQEPPGADMTKPVVRKLRCAVYTRKSSEEGLEQEFNSLHAQREACEAYIASQRSEGWVLVRDQYDDGGISGGTLERPGLKRLLEDIEDGLVDVVVVYKIDRLSRSLADFAKLVEVFDRNGVTFVSVTQSFNTTTSMGRLTLNILLLRPVRARGDGRAHPRQGRRQPEEGHVDGRRAALRLPGREPEAGDRREAAAHVRWIFARFLEIGSCTELAREVAHAASARRAATGSTRSTSTGC
jgi:DNA invertase Pin-like site-specific DNA recombinase